MIEYSNSEIEHVIDEYIHSKRDRDILKSRFIDGLTFDEISEKYHISTRHAKTIVYKEQEKVFWHLSITPFSRK